jgi:hypothetical protein
MDKHQEFFLFQRQHQFLPVDGCTPAHQTDRERTLTVLPLFRKSDS